MDNVEVVPAKCTAISYEGRGICKDNDKTIFVAGMFPGDEGTVEILYKRSGFYFGKIKTLTTLAPDRVKPLCKVSTACGGCVFQAYAYHAQADWKRDVVIDQFKKLVHLDVKVNDCIKMEHPYHYRNKIQVPFAKGMYGLTVYGFYKENSHNIVQNDECVIEDLRAKKILRVMESLLNELHIPPYDEKTGKGVIRHALIRTSFHKEEVMLVIVSAVNHFNGREEFVSRVRSECPEITTVIENINPKKTNVILGEEEKTLYGKGYIEDVLCGLNFKISAKSFYQTNPEMTETLYKTALDYADIQKDDVVIDAYAGVGTIGLLAAKKAKKVLSVEILKDASDDGRENAKNNGIENAEFVNDDAAHYLTEYIKTSAAPDVVIMDPPRKGSSAEFLNSLKASKAKKVIYVSCNPSSLARDVALLVDSYDIKLIQPLDCFPFTHAVETVVLLTIKA